MGQCQKIAAILLFALIPATASARQEPADSIAALCRDNTGFAVALYGSLSGLDGNLFFSPYSISTSMAMTYAGARGLTEEQMSRVMHFRLAGNGLHRAFKGLAETMRSDADEESGFELHGANSLWGQTGYRFLPEFLDLTSEYYGAEPFQLDFSEDPESCREIINMWTQEQTEGRISDLLPVDVLTTATRLVLSSAIFFRADWLFQFDPMGTFPCPFTLLTGQEVEVPTMTLSEHFRTMEDDGYSALELPYRERDFLMLIILPDSGRFPEIEDSLDVDLILGILERLEDASLDLRMPKFSIASQFLLGETLQSMGMTAAFGPEADFSGMDGTNWLYISSVVHQAVISVDEYGTEAAAATAVVMAKLNGESSSPFRVDRPFIYLIMERNTGAVLFMGRVLDPLDGRE
jgi:serpin B